MNQNQPKTNNWKDRIYTIIFEADTRGGKAFDVALLIFIVLSVVVVILESIRPLGEAYNQWFMMAEWTFTILFTIEYFLRIVSVRNPRHYIFSFYGIIDLLAILPTYLSLLFVGSQYLLTIRALRLLRIFRIFKLGRFIMETSILARALRNSRHKIVIFFFTVITIVVFIASAMYVIEGGQPGSGFTSIPKAMYWAIVTITTVGFGDITPVTNLGQFLSAILMLTGYAIIAVPTGIFTSELAMAHREKKETLPSCETCGKRDLPADANYCSNCGQEL